MSDLLAAFLMLAGSLFALLAALGVLRFPDTFTRMQATTKAATLGVGLSMVAAMVVFRDAAVFGRGLTVILFVFLTTPVAAHMIARAAYFARNPMTPETVADELSGEYDLERHEFKSG